MEHHLHFFTLLNAILLWLGLGFGPVDKHRADITQKHVANIAQKREGLLCLTQMSEMAWNNFFYTWNISRFFLANVIFQKTPS